MPWILLTLSATVFQTFRNSFAKNLSYHVGPLSVSFSRFLFGLPVSIVGLVAVVYLYGRVGHSSLWFYYWVFVFSVMQIAANALLIVLFRYKNFAVAITYTKTEGMFTALLAVLFLHEFLPLVGWLGIVVALVGLFVASFAKKKISPKAIVHSLGDSSTLLGLLSGLLFALATVSIKHAFEYVDAETGILKPIFALFVAQAMQVALLLPYLFVKKRSELRYLFSNILTPMAVGVFSGLGSMAWFVAFSLAFVGYVKTLGQLEFVLSVLVSLFYFKEKINKSEILGMLLLVLGSVLLIIS